MDEEIKHALVDENDEPFITFLNSVVLWGVRVLSVLVVLVILWALIDVIVHVYQQFAISFASLFSSETLFSTLGAFLVVLIAIEIFLNIIFFLKKDTVNVPLVLATALTAIARKVIILDYTAVSSDHMYATAALILAVGLTYWLITKKS